MSEQKVFLKGKKYVVNQGLQQSEEIVLCTKTTCSLSSTNFEGVSLKSGDYSESWATVSFKELKK